MRKRRLEASACSQLPIWQEPVKEIALSGGASTSAWPSSPPDPATKLTTPFGKPASSKAFTRRQALSGAALAGFSTTVLPQISAGASFHAGMALGKFHAPPAAQNTGNIAAGAIWVNTVQTISPGFQGYMFAVCNFQYAHGFAFISDVGARNLAMGYLAIVIPDPGTGTRNATPACQGISGCSTTGEQDAH